MQVRVSSRVRLRSVVVAQTVLKILNLLLQLIIFRLQTLNTLASPIQPVPHPGSAQSRLVGFFSGGASHNDMVVAFLRGLRFRNPSLTNARDHFEIKISHLNYPNSHLFVRPPAARGLLIS